MLQLQHNVKVSVRREAHPVPALIARAQPTGVRLAIVEAVIGYEWLLSALKGRTSSGTERGVKPFSLLDRWAGACVS